MGRPDGRDRAGGDDEDRDPVFRMGTVTTVGDPELERRARRLREDREGDEDLFFGLGTITTMGDPDLEGRARRLREEREDEG